MAGQKARIDKDSNGYLSKNSRPESEAGTAYDDTKSLEGAIDPVEEPGPTDKDYTGGTKKDKTRKADQHTTGTTGIGDTGTGLEKAESANPFASVIQKRFSGLFEADNAGAGSAPATSDSPSLGMMSVNNTDFRPAQLDVRAVLEGIALQAAEAFEMIDENSQVPDAIVNELQNTARAVNKIYEFANKNSSDNTAEPSDSPVIAKDTAQSKPGVNEEVEELEELSKDAVSKYANRAFDQSNSILKSRNLDLPKNVKKSAEDAKERRRKGIVSAGKRLGDDEMKKISQASAHRIVYEKLEGDQKNIDKNHNGKLDAQDFKMLRSKKTVKEAVDLVFQEILRGKFDGDY